MDPVAYLSTHDWDVLKSRNSTWNEVSTFSKMKSISFQASFSRLYSKLINNREILIGLKKKNSFKVDLRDRRYDQIIHMVTAAKGAEKFYALDNNTTRTEGIEMARMLDKKTSNAWIGHPYIDVIDNGTGFDMKIARVLQAICLRTGIQLRGCDIGAKKRKFLVRSVPDPEVFPQHQDFNVVHNYLVAVSKNIQARIRRRGQAS